MTNFDFVGHFIEPLEQLQIPYMITGGVAAIIYGDPRFTRDIDVVLSLRAHELEGLRASFSDEDFYLPPTETLETEVARDQGGHFKIVHRPSALRACVYLVGDDPLHDRGLERRKRIEVEPTDIWLAPIEYVVLRKLECYETSGSERHLRDVAMMLRISGDALDHNAFDGWGERRDLRAALNAAREYPIEES